MNISTTALICALALTSTIAVTACSSGGGNNNPDNNDDSGVTYTGSTSPAAINATNAEKIGTSATEGVAQAVEAEISGDVLPFAVAISKKPNSQLHQKLREITLDLIENRRAINLPLGIVLDGDDFPAEMGYCGGSVTIPDNMYSGSDGRTNGTITYNNLCMDAGTGYGRMTINGSLIFSQTETRFSMTYRNFTIRYNGETYTMNSTYSCDILSSGFYDNCSTSSDYAGSDGSTYRMRDVSISGNDSSGYSVNASFCHPSYGCVTITTTSPITFNCTNGMPDSGAISYTGANGSSGTISFDSCTGYSGTYDDGGGSVVSFSGSWPS